MSDEIKTSGKMNAASYESDASKIAELPCEYPAKHVSVKLVQSQEAHAIRNQASRICSNPEIIVQLVLAR